MFLSSESGSKDKKRNFNNVINEINKEKKKITEKRRIIIKS